MTTEEKTKPVSDLFDQAMKSYEQAWKTGAKMQEESAKYFSSFVSQTTTPGDFQKRVKAITEDFIPLTQRSFDEGMKMIEQSSRTSVELLKKAVAAAQATSPQDAQAKMLGLWEASLNAMRDSVIAVTQANNKALESWVACARKGGEPAPAAPKA